MKTNIPSIDPADNGTLSGTFKFVYSKFLETQDDMLPAKVIAYEPGPPGFVQVQPLIAILGTGGDRSSRAAIAKVPVLTLGAGGFVMTFPIKPGDFGWIKANDRDISLFLQTLTEAQPATLRKHSFSDAVFIPMTFDEYQADENNLVIQKNDGTVKISLSDDTISIEAPKVNILGKTEVNVTSNVEINITAPTVNVSGNLLVDGNVAATGTITPGP